MSSDKFNCALTIVPVDMHFMPSQEIAQSALDHLFKLFPYAEEYVCKPSEVVRFISPQLFAFEVSCPVCGIKTVRGKSRDEPGRQWFFKIDRLDNEAVESIQTTLPACGHTVPFTALQFDSPAGFAKFALTARFNYFDDHLMADEFQQSEELESLRQLLGTPLKAVRTYFSLLPSDRQKIEGLISDSDDVRQAAAQTLDSEGAGQFEENTISQIFIEDISDKLLSSYKATKHDGVKNWILFLLGYAEFVNDEFIDIASSELRPDSTILNQVLYLIFRNARHFQHLKSKIKLLFAHSNSEVRWRVATALRYLSLTYAEDIEVIRALMLDDFYATRTEALFAFKSMIADAAINNTDEAVLRKIIDLDASSAAAYYARELLNGKAF